MDRGCGKVCALRYACGLFYFSGSMLCVDFFGETKRFENLL